MAFGKITGSVIQDNTITESNLAFGVSGQSAASAWATDTLKVNIIESDDSSLIDINDSVRISGSLNVDTISSDDSTAVNIENSLKVEGGLNVTSGAEIYGTLFVQILASEDSTEINVQDPMDISGYIRTGTVVTDFIRSDNSTAITVNDSLRVDGTLQANNLAVNTITSPDSTGINIDEAQLYVNGQAVLNIGSGASIEQTVNTANVSDVIINNSGTIFRIPLANIDISSFNNDAGYAAGGVSGFSSSTTTSFPVEQGDSAARDYGDSEPAGLGTGTTDNTDAFGVALGVTYDCMEPNGSLITQDLGTDEAYVGA